MILSIQQNRNFTKRLDTLRRSGGHASLAARNADEIIANIANGCGKPQEIGRQTKYGEARIKNCMKFNLGNGYRLVTIRNHQRLVLLYVGTHDECDRWLEANRDHQPEYESCESTIFAEQEPADALSSGKSRDTLDDEYEERLLKKIDQKDLKQIFNGLLGQNP